MISVLVDDLLIMGASEKLVMPFSSEIFDVYKVSQFEKVKVYNGIHISRELGNTSIYFPKNTVYLNSSRNAR